MGSIIEQIEYLRNEIAARDNQLMAGVMVIAVLITACYVAGKISGNQDLYRLMMMFLIGGVIFVGRQEHLEKRNVPWIAMAEHVLQTGGDKVQDNFVNWEDYLRTLKSRWFYLAPTDVLCGLAFFWMFYDWLATLLKWNWRLSDEAFVYCCLAALPLAVIWVFVGRWAADK